MPDRRDIIAITATLVAETTWLFPALGIFGIVFGQGASPLPFAAIAGLISFGFIVGRIVAHLVEDPTQRASFQALFGLVVIYFAMSVVAMDGGIDLLWGPRLFGSYSGKVAFGLALGTVAAGFLWYRGVQIGSDSLPQSRLLQTFRTGVMVLSVSFLAEQSFDIDCFTTIMLFPFFAVSLAGLAFARMPPGGAWTRMVLVVILGVIGGGLIIGSIGVLVGGRGLDLLSAAWGHLINAIGWLLSVLLVPVLEVIFGFIAWLFSGMEFGKSEPVTLRPPIGAWRDYVDSANALPYADLVILLLKYLLLPLFFYLAYRLLLLAYQGYVRHARTVTTTNRESIQGDADAKADLISLALGLLPDWMFPQKTLAGPRFPKNLPGISEVYALYFDMLTVAYKNGHDFVPSATPCERRSHIENVIPGAPVAPITDLFNAACYGNVAADHATIDRLRRELESAVSIG